MDWTLLISRSAFQQPTRKIPQDLAPPRGLRRPQRSPLCSSLEGAQLPSRDPIKGSPSGQDTLPVAPQTPGRASGSSRGSNAGFNFPNLRRGPRFLPRRRDPRTSASPTWALAVALSAPSCLLLPPPPPLQNSSMGAKQTFCCHLLSTARFQKQPLTQEPGGAGSARTGPGALGWAARSSSGAC